MSSQNTVDRLEIAEHWILPAVAAGAIVRIYFASEPERARIPARLRPLVVVLGLAEVHHHSATELTFTMQKQLVTSFPGRSWYGKVDDDAFVLLHNLMFAINLRVRDQMRHSRSPQSGFPSLMRPRERAIVLGRVLKNQKMASNGLGVISGGASYWQTRPAVLNASAAMAADSFGCHHHTAEDVRLTCLHRALKTDIGEMSGMYINSPQSVAAGEFLDEAPEGLLKHPISFHWVSNPQQACPLLACFYRQHFGQRA
eukprot:g6245.t1